MGAIASHSTATSTGAWDGPANEARLPSARGPLRAAHAWVDSVADPDTKGAYRFIHHFVSAGGTVGAASTVACSAGIAVLNGGRGGTTIPAGDRAGVYAHLARHLRDANLEPPPLRSALADDQEWRDMNAVERRYTAVPVVESRASDGGSPRVGGYAAKFNRLSQNLGGYVEQIAPTFFNKSRGDGWPGVIARYNHDDNMLLGTSDSGTLRLTVDDTGLLYDVTPPSSRADVVELVGRGDVRQSSFAFRVPAGGEDWGLSDQGYPMRTLLTGQLLDVAPVNSPAYLDTSAALRSLAAVKEADLDEVRKLAESDELRKLFVVTTGPAPAKVKPKLFGPAAAAALLARRQDPWE